MRIGEKLRRLDDRVLGPPKREPLAKRVAAMASVLAAGGGLVARGLLGDDASAVLPGAVAVVVAAVFAGLAARTARREAGPVTPGRVGVTAAGSLLLGAAPLVAVPALRTGLAATISMVAAVLVAGWVTERVVLAPDPAGPPPDPAGPPPGPAVPPREPAGRPPGGERRSDDARSGDLT